MKKNEVQLSFIKYEDDYDCIHYAARVADEIIHLVSIPKDSSSLMDYLHKQDIFFEKLLGELNHLWEKALFLHSQRTNRVACKLVFNKEIFSTVDLVRSQKHFIPFTVENSHLHINYTIDEIRYLIELMRSKTSFGQ